MDGETCDRFERCEDCAFTAGTSANASKLTRLKAKLCAETGEPFACHIEAKDLERQGLPLSVALERVQAAGRLRLCGGYVEALERLAARGFHEAEPEWRQGVRRALLKVIERGELDPSLAEGEAFHAEFLRVLGEEVFVRD